MRKVRRFAAAVWPWIWSWGALVLAAAFFALDVGSVGGWAWQWLAYLFAGAFIAQLLYANRRLTALQDKDSGRRSFIGELTALSTEGIRLAEHPGNAGGWFFVGGPPSDLEIKHDQQQKEYASLRVEWSQRVRAKLELGAPEFLADWEAADFDDRYALLRSIIRDVRQKL